MTRGLLGLLPLLLSAVLLFLFVTRLSSRFGVPPRRFLPFFLSAVSFATLAVILTETLSAFSALSRQGLSNAWWLSACALALLNLLLSRMFTKVPASPIVRESARGSHPPSAPERRLHAQVASALRGLTPYDRLSGLLGGALLCLFLLTLIVAIVYPPNNYDSMIYHVARVMHWAQQGSVAHYPTSVFMQLQGAPLAEFFLLHLYLLTGSDALFNLVQWFSFVLTVLAVYSAAELLFPRGGLTAAALAATLPMGVLQATSTQNDLVAASWLAVSLFLGLCVVPCRPRAIVLLPFTTLAFGLAAFAKPTVFPMAAGLAAAFFGCLVLRRVPFPVLVLSASLILLPSVPFYARNLVFFGLGSPYGPAHGLPNEEVSVVGVASNLLRNAALHSQVPLSGAICDAFNAGSLGILRKCHELLPVSIEDARFTIEKGNAFQPKRRFHEDITGNPLHFILFLVCVPIAFFGVCRTSVGAGGARRRVAVRRALPLMCCVAVGLLTVWSYLKWSPFACRYDLALFVLACVPMGGLVAGLRRSFRALLLLTGFALAFTAVCLNASRPVAPLLLAGPFDRREAYFANRPDLLSPYVEIVRVIKAAGCHQVGYRPGMTGAYQFEYPFWVLLGEGGYSFRFEHVGVVSPSGRELRDASFRPCSIISPEEAPDRRAAFQLHLEGSVP